jgi:hypothetical protein
MRTGGLFRRNTTNATSKREEDFADYATIISTEVCNKKLNFMFVLFKLFHSIRFYSSNLINFFFFLTKDDTKILRDYIKNLYKAFKDKV